MANEVMTDWPQSRKVLIARLMDDLKDHDFENSPKDSSIQTPMFIGDGNGGTMLNPAFGKQ
jgi:hypothetical protein